MYVVLDSDPIYYNLFPRTFSLARDEGTLLGGYVQFVAAGIFFLFDCFET